MSTSFSRRFEHQLRALAGHAPFAFPAGEIPPSFRRAARLRRFGPAAEPNG
jgi:hypothetical protein